MTDPQFMDVERCVTCDEPTSKTGKCEDSLYVGDSGPYCEICFGWKTEVERLKGHTWEQEREAIVEWLVKQAEILDHVTDISASRAVQNLASQIKFGEHSGGDQGGQP